MKDLILLTPLENKLAELVPFEKPVDSTYLIEKYFGKDPPFNARTILIGRLRTIAKKAEAGRFPWRLQKTHRSGPIPQSFWREKA